MQDAVLVGVMDGASDEGDQPSRGLRVGAQRRGPVREAAALDPLHTKVIAALVFADLVDRHDVGMLQAGGGLGLVTKAFHFLGGGKPAFPDHFQGDDTVQADLPRPIHHAHSAAGNLLLQFVVAETTARTRQRGGSVPVDGRLPLEGR